MKKYFFILFALCAFIGCKDNSGLYGLLTDYDSRIGALETLCSKMNTNIESLQTIVEVQQTGDYITGITPIMSDGEEIGYTITFAKHDPITIYHGQNGKDGVDGSNGTDGHTPLIGIAKDADGAYYWTLDGEWLLDGNGDKLPVSGKDGENGTDGTNGITPQLKIEADYWWISYDNGSTWTQLGQAKGDKGDKGEDGDSMFQSVIYDENTVTITLENGEVIVINRGDGTSGDIVPVVDGAIMAEFFVSATKKVYFSKGNLQYNAVLGTHQCADGTTKQGTWRFAENQYDIVGSDNKNISSVYNGWIDLFAWGTSGYKYSPDTTYHGYISSTASNNHPLAISADIEYTRYDWGKYNEISSADNNYQWRTLNKEEWKYLLANQDWYLATVNNIAGLILLPKIYDEPMYVTHISKNNDFSQFTYNIKTWKLIENQGTVFLPAAGYMYTSDGTSIIYEENSVNYWTSTLASYSTTTSSFAYALQKSKIDNERQHLCLSVRLVKDVE